MCVCVYFGFQAEPIMGLGCVYVCVCVFALGLAGFGSGLVYVFFGFQAEPTMGLRFVFDLGLVGLGLVCVGFGFQAEPVMGLRCVCVCVFALGLVGFGSGLVCLFWVPS